MRTQTIVYIGELRVTLTGVGRAFILSPVSLIIFVWLQIVSKNSEFFLAASYSSFIFLAIATLAIVSSNLHEASRQWRALFYVLLLVAALVTAGAAYTIATVPAGGTRHYYSTQPSLIQIDMAYGLTAFGTPGYHGGWSQRVFDVNYSVGAVFLLLEVYGLNVVTDKSIAADLTVGISLQFWPNHLSFRAVDRYVTASSRQSGTESSVSFIDHTNLITWGSTPPEWRMRLDKGYTAYLSIGVDMEALDYGPISATIPFTDRVQGDDLQVTSSLEDGVALVLSGIFIGALLSIPARQLKPRTEQALAPVLKQLDGLFVKPEDTPKSFLKNCVKCGKEIPIASEQCPFCNTKQP